jgi:hypothetical protein
MVDVPQRGMTAYSVEEPERIFMRTRGIRRMADLNGRAFGQPLAAYVDPPFGGVFAAEALFGEDFGDAVFDHPGLVAVPEPCTVRGA